MMQPRDNAQHHLAHAGHGDLAADRAQPPRRHGPPRARPTSRLALLLLASAGTGCTGSDDPPEPPIEEWDAAPAPDAPAPDASPPPCVPDPAAPVVHLVFPPPRGLTETATLTVRGTAADEDGVAAVRVNGVAASSDDGFATWQASIPLTTGDNPVQVASEDALGNVASCAATARITRQETPLYRPSFLLSQGDGNGPVLAMEHNRHALLALDPVTGTSQVVSRLLDDTQGPAIGTVTTMALDPERDQVLVLQRLPAALYAVDLPASGAAIDLRYIHSPVVDSGAPGDPGTGARLLLASGLEAAVVAVDLETGARTTLAHPGSGSGPAWESVDALALAPASRRLLVGDRTSRALFALDLDSGARSLVSGAQAGSGPLPDALGNLALDASRDRVLVGDRFRVLAVDLVTGDRTVLASTRVGGGASWSRPHLVARHPADTAPWARMLVGARELGAAFARPFTIYEVHPDTGERRVLADESTGTGPRLSSLASIQPYQAPTPGASAGTALVLQNTDLLLLDLATGDRTLLSGADAGDGPAIISARSLALDLTQNRALIACGPEDETGSGRVLSVDLATGNRTMLSSEEVGEGVLFINPDGSALDTAGNRLLLGDANPDAIVAVDLTTGARSELWNNPEGALAALNAIALDAPRGRVLVSDFYHSLLAAVDLETGALVPVAGAGAGTGPLPNRPEHVTLDAEHELALVADSDLAAVLAVDLHTGERMLVSR